MAKAISTSLYDLCVCIYRLVVFILLGNPLSMCILNLFAPRKTAEFAKNRNLFGEQLYSFYERVALKWPFFWAKWWMLLENIRKYTIKQQIQYFFKVSFKNNTAEDTLKKMRGGDSYRMSEACRKLFFSYGDKELPITETRWYQNDSVSVMGVHPTVRDFMMRNIRLDSAAMQLVFNRAIWSEDTRNELRKYLSRGAICYYDLNMLIDSAADKGEGADLRMLGILLDYIKRYGLEREMLDHAEVKYPKVIFETVLDALNWHKQMKAVKTYTKTMTSCEWHNFCVNTKQILPEVQALMNFNQYLEFRACGLTLDPKAVEEILYHGTDKEMWKSIFKFEPNHGLVKGSPLYELVVNTPSDWNKVYKKAMKELADFYNREISSGRKLNNQSELEMLEMEDAAKYVRAYRKYAKLSPEAEKLAKEKGFI